MKWTYYKENEPCVEGRDLESWCVIDEHGVGVLVSSRVEANSLCRYLNKNRIKGSYEDHFREHYLDWLKKFEKSS